MYIGDSQANSLNEDDLNYAQSHLRILSGLYGILKPLDLNSSPTAWKWEPS